jgi:DNA-directed RNA polymerase II subunit RPB9
LAASGDMDDSDLHAFDGDEQEKVVRLRFCPETNDLLYPQAAEVDGKKRLVYVSKTSEYIEYPEEKDWCVYRRNVKHTTKDKTVVITDVRSDPTLPRETNVSCPQCGHNEAVIFCNSSERGMTLYLNCVHCSHRWKEAV